jgi:TonB family protein
MRLREAHIPILLWVCAAAMVHLGGAHEGERLMALEEGKSSLRHAARSLATPVPMEAEFPEGSTIDVTPEPQPLPEASAQPPEATSATPSASVAPKPAEKLPDPPKADKKVEPPKPKPEKKAEPPKPPEKKAEPPKPPEKKKDEEKPEEPKKKEELPKLPPPPPPPPPEEKNVAVQQLQKKDEEKNDLAKFLAEKNHHVKPDEQTQASITSLVENNPDPSPGTSAGGPPDRPGNGDKDVVAQDEDRQGEKVAPNVVPPNQPKPAIPIPPNSTAIAPPPGPRTNEAPGTPKIASAPGNPPPAVAPPPPGTGPKGGPVSAPKAPDQLSAANGADTVGKPASPNVATAPSTSPAPGASGDGRPKYKLPELPQANGGNKWVAGLGSGFTGKGGDPTSLKPNVIAGAVGQQQLDKLRTAEAETRISKHRGEWKSALLERWRPAIENYVAGVRAGNQTNLGTRAAPFATYLNLIHNRLHPLFSEGFVDRNDDLPVDSILRDKTLVSWMEIVLRPDGTIHHLGIVRPSGSTAFDLAALDAVDRAAPFGNAPKEIVSPDGLIYLHWEFHNDMERCSTANARPYILDESTKAKPGPEPTKPAPPPTTNEKLEKKTGALPERRRGASPV